MTWGELEYTILANQVRSKRLEEQHEELMDAIRENDLTGFFTLVESGTSVNFIYDNMTPLYMALEYNNIDIFKVLLDLNADINQVIDGHTVVWESLWQQKTEFFLLMASKIKKSTKDSDGKTILMEAVALSNLEAVKACITYKHNVNAQDKNGNTPLHYALNKDKLNDNDKAIINILIMSGADPLAQNHNGNSPSDMAEKATAPTQAPSAPKNTNAGPKKTQKRIQKLTPK